MVDFKKRLAGKKADKPVDPVKLYDTLDRAHDKGPLRPAQLAVLQDWFKNHQSTRDVIVKLHTGQGKTLIGLLMLQSRLNAGQGPAVYLCPDNFLIDQTCEQAKQFGISTCKADPDLPEAFVNGETILVTSVQKMFNGLTKFGLHRRSAKVGTLLMDDAHACSDIIREASRIRIPSMEPAYAALQALFAEDLEPRESRRDEWGGGAVGNEANDAAIEDEALRNRSSVREASALGSSCSGVLRRNKGGLRRSLARQARAWPGFALARFHQLPANIVGVQMQQNSRVSAWVPTLRSTRGRRFLRQISLPQNHFSESTAN